MNDRSSAMGTDVQGLIEQLKDSKASKRDEALAGLAKLGNPATIPAIVEVLMCDKNDNTRKFAAHAINTIGHKDAARPLIQALEKEKQAFVRKEIITALGNIAVPETVLVLGRALREEEDFQVRFAAAVALQKIGDPEAVLQLRSGLGAGIPTNLRGFIVKILGEMKARVAAEDIANILKSDKDDNVRRSAVSAVTSILGEEAIPALAEALEERRYPKVQVRAAEQLGVLGSTKCIDPLCSALLASQDSDLRDRVAEALKEIPDWKTKTDQFIKILQSSDYQRSDIPSAAIISSISLPHEVAGANPYALTDHLISHAVDKDKRMTDNLAALIIASSSGDLRVAGERINAYQREKGILDKRLDPLRIQIGGETALDPVMQMLSDDLRNYFRVPVKELNDLTQSNWKKTTEYAQRGFLARMVMSVIVFSVGIMLLLVSSYQMLFQKVDPTQYYGVGVSFVSGLGTMLLIIYTGPLREIRKAVEDLGIASAAFIAYIHRVLQISHTFSFYYLRQNITFEEMKKSSELIEKAMRDTIEKLEGRDQESGAEIIQKVSKEFKTTPK